MYKHSFSVNYDLSLFQLILCTPTVRIFIVHYVNYVFVLQSLLSYGNLKISFPLLSPFPF